MEAVLELMGMGICVLCSLCAGMEYRRTHPTITHCWDCHLHPFITTTSADMLAALQHKRADVSHAQILLDIARSRAEHSAESFERAKHAVPQSQSPSIWPTSAVHTDDKREMVRQVFTSSNQSSAALSLKLQVCLCVCVSSLRVCVCV